MEDTTGKKVSFEPTELLLGKAVEAIDGAEAANYEQAIKLSDALGGVYARENLRLAEKYGTEHPRTQQAKLRLELGAEARKALSARYSEVTTPTTDPETGWTVDGYVTAIDGKPAENVTVAVYDRAALRLEEFPPSVTDKSGYFSIAVEKLPEKATRVYVRASIGDKILKSNENLLAPTAGGRENIKIALEAESKDVYKTTPNVKINLAQMRDETPAEAEGDAVDFDTGDEPPNM